MPLHLSEITESLQHLGRTRKRDDHFSFFLGKFTGTLAALITFAITANLIFAAIASAMLFFLYGDARNSRIHNQLIQDPEADWQAWDKQHHFLYTGFNILLGIWCFACFALTDDVFCHTLCIATSMGIILGLISRDFRDERSVNLQMWFVAIPLLLGILVKFDTKDIILFFFLIPIFMNIKTISNRFRILFEDIVQSSKEKEEFGSQLNEAMESMSHGLLMFDKNMKLNIINGSARKILQIDPDINIYSMNLKELANTALIHKCNNERIQMLEVILLRRLKQNTTETVFEFGSNMFVEMTIIFRNQGGCVLVIEDVTDRIKYQRMINQLAKYDELTGLLNRRYFLEQAKQSMENIKNDSKGALIFFDLDDFKRINDTLGHETGDYILSTLAQRLRNLLPNDALIARYGGDEFVLFLDADLGEAKLAQLASKILEVITEKITYNNQELRYGASLGIAQFPKDANNINRLLKLADLALYEAKNNGKKSYRFFTAELEHQLQQRVELEEDLVKAVRQDELTLNFQPIVTMNTGAPKVFEALTRWNRNGNQISPEVFIPLAEDLGLIREIGEWTLIEACRQCKTWPEESSVAVNLSVVQFQVSSVVRAVENALAMTGLHPSRLEIEITESAVLNDMNHAIDILNKLSELGVRISLDDFGTGYSSLSYLHKLPLDKIKIDKSFIDDLVTSERSRTLLKGITVLGKALGLKIVVEGIETAEQMDLLRANYDVDFIQGYHFSKPLPPDEAKAYTARYYAEHPTVNDMQKQIRLAQSA